MSILRKLAGSLAALALVAGFAAPSASADRGDRIRGERSLTHGHEDGRRHDGRRGDDRHARHDRHRGHRGYRSHDRRDWRRYEHRRHSRHQDRWQHDFGRHDRHDWRHRSRTVRPPVHHLKRYQRHHYRQPYYSDYNQKPRVRYHAPRYVPRYRVGGHYGYGRHTVVIRDYRRHGLYHPPRGYHWVRDADRGDAILCSVATGAIIGLVVGALSH